MYKEAAKVLKDFEKRNGKNGIIYFYRASESLVNLDFENFEKNSISGINEKNSDIEEKVKYLTDFFDGYFELHNDTIMYNYGKSYNNILEYARNEYPENFNICLLYSEWLRAYKDDNIAYINELKHILSFNNQSNELYKNIVYHYISENKLDSAIYYSNVAINYFPDEAIYYYPTTFHYILKDDYKSALKYAERGVEYVQKLSNLHLLFLEILGECYYKTGDKNSAYNTFDYLLKIDPSNVSVLNNYAYYLSLDELNLSRAKQMSYKTIMVEPKNPVYLDTYAWILYKLGEYNDAEKYMKKAIENINDDSDKITYYEHYYEILIANNMKELADEYKNKLEELKVENSSK